MSYTSVPMELSSTHIKKLANGESTKLSHENLSGDMHTVYLTKSQAQRVQKALNSGKSLTLKFSARQLKKNAMSGSGLWDSLLSYGKENLLPVAKDLAKDLAKKGLDAGLNYGVGKLKDYANKKIDGRGLLGENGRGRMKIMPVPVAVQSDDRVVVAPNKLDLVVNHPQMVRGAKPVAVMQGEGFFDDLGGFVSDTVKGVRNAGLAGLQQGVAKRIGGGVGKRGRPKKQPQQGLGFFDDLGGFVSDTVKGVRNAGLAGLQQGVAKRIGGGLKGRPKKAVGGSFTLNPH
jgi:hypothetical protein